MLRTERQQSCAQSLLLQFCGSASAAPGDAQREWAAIVLESPDSSSLQEPKSALDVNIHLFRSFSEATNRGTSDVSSQGQMDEPRLRVLRGESSTGCLIAQFQQGSRPDFGVTAAVIKIEAVMTDTAQLTSAKAPTASLGACGPFFEEPGGAGQR